MIKDYFLCQVQHGNGSTSHFWCSSSSWVFSELPKVCESPQDLAKLKQINTLFIPKTPKPQTYEFLAIIITIIIIMKSVILALLLTNSSAVSLTNKFADGIGSNVDEISDNLLNIDGKMYYVGKTQNSFAAAGKEDSGVRA